MNIRDAGGGGGDSLIDPGDQATLCLPGLEPKRGRGRPRKPDALTPAQRAQRYRDREKRKVWFVDLQGRRTGGYFLGW